MHGGTADQSFYRGTDRRLRIVSRRTIGRGQLVVFGAGAVVATVVVPVVLAAAEPSRSVLLAQLTLRNIWAILFLAAGVLQLVRWRATGETRTGVRGAGTLSLGLLTVPTTTLVPMLYRPVGGAALEPVTRTLAVIACTALLTRAAQGPAIDTRTRPLRLLAVVVAAGWIFLTAVLLLTHDHRSIDIGAPQWFWLEAALVACWIICGVATAQRAVRDRAPSFAWMAVAVLLMATAEGFRAAALVGPPDLQYFATGIQLCVGALVLANAAADLVVLLSAESSRMHQLSGTVQEAVQQLSADAAAESTRRHDARTVLASLKAASLVLDRYDDALDVGTRARLLGSFNVELNRLECLIERRPGDALEQFSLDAALADAFSDIGDVAVRWQLSGLSCCGRGDELSALVRTVVTTLGRRCADRSVRVRVIESAAGIQVRLDAGGRVDRADWGAATLRLEIARRVIREQGGDILLDERWDGGASAVFCLQAATQQHAGRAVAHR